MKIKTIVKYVCSFCGEEFDEREDCIYHEEKCEDEFRMKAYEIKCMCNRRLDEGKNCKSCLFHDSVNTGCLLLGIPANWKRIERT